MSETTTMPFQPGTLADDDVTPEVSESAGNRRLLIVLAGAGALVVLVVAGYFLLFSGGSNETAPDAVVPAPQGSVQPSTSPSTAPKTATLPKISAKNFGTDPFKALISETVAGGTGATTTDTTAAGGTTTGSTTTDTSSTGTTTGTSTGSTPVASTAYKFQVVKVAANNGTVDVKVNGKAYKGLQAGEVFGKIFKVRFIGGTVNSFQIGDEVFNVSGAKAVTISS